MKKFLATVSQTENPAKEMLTMDFFLHYIFISFVLFAFAISLGIAFLIMLVGFRFPFLRLAFYWMPTNRIMNYMMQVTKAKIRIPLIPRLPWYSYIPVALSIIIGIWLIGFGMSMLLADGFCAQNFFC